MGKVKDIIAKDTLYLIVIKEVWDRIVNGTKTIEYRERTNYWEREYTIESIVISKSQMDMEMPHVLIDCIDMQERLEL